MRTQSAIIVAGLLIAASTAAILWATRYDVAQPFDPNMFRRYDRWTGRVELCASRFDDRTYCDRELVERAQKAVEAENAAALKVLHGYGFSEEEIKTWPKHVFEGARNGVANGGDKASIVAWLELNHVEVKH